MPPCGKWSGEQQKRFDEYGILTDNILALKKNGNEYRAKMEELAKQFKEARSLLDEMDAPKKASEDPAN